MIHPAWRRLAATSREAALTLGAILGTTCLLFLIAGVVFHVKPLVVRSGSMEPTIATGALAISHTVAADDLAVGDIVSVKTLTGTRVTHRVVEIQHQGHTAQMTLKGDANGTVDQQVYSVTSAERVVLDVPYLGYVVAWTSGQVGVFLGGLVAGGLLLLAWRSPSRTEPRKPSGRSRRSRGTDILGAAVVVAALGLGGHASLGSQMTWAFWNDSATLTGFSATSYTVPAPVIATCAPSGVNGARVVTLTWPGVTSPPTTYTVQAPAITVASAPVTGTTTKTATITYNSNLAANQNKRVTVTITPFVSTWFGSGDTWQFQTPGNAGAPTCGEKIAPTVAIGDPDGVTRATAAQMQTYMSGSTGCNNTGRAACGTMSDTSTITNVDYILQRVQLGVTQCFDGTTYVTDCTTWQAGSIASQTTWRVLGLNNFVYATPGGAFNLQVRVTDMWGNQTTVSRGFTVNP